MSFKPAHQLWFQDILDAIDMIEKFTVGMAFEAFRSNPMAIGQHSIRLNDQFRICFRCGADGVYDVEVVDYH